MIIDIIMGQMDYLYMKEKYMIHPHKVPFLAEKMSQKGKTDFDNLQENNYLPSFSLMS